MASATISVDTKTSCVAGCVERLRNSGGVVGLGSHHPLRCFGNPPSGSCVSGASGSRERTSIGGFFSSDTGFGVVRGGAEWTSVLVGKGGFVTGGGDSIGGGCATSI